MSAVENRREVAWRLFAAEFDDASFSYSEGDEERAPNYVVTPTGARVNRLFAVGVLTEVEQVNEDVLRGRVVDPTGAFVTYAGQYQPDAMAFLDRATPPAFVSLTGKARTYEPEDSDRVFTSVRPESINEVDAETRDRWVVSAARATFERVAVVAAARELDVRGDDLRATLEAAGVDDALATGIPLALDHYGTTEHYLESLRRLAVEALELVAGDRDAVGELDASPGETGPSELGALPDVPAADAVANATPVTADATAESADATAEPAEPAASEEAASDAGRDDGDAAVGAAEATPTGSATAESAADSGESAGASTESTTGTDEADETPTQTPETTDASEPTAEPPEQTTETAGTPTETAEATESAVGTAESTAETADGPVETDDPATETSESTAEPSESTADATDAPAESTAETAASTDDAADPTGQSSESTSADAGLGDFETGEADADDDLGDFGREDDDGREDESAEADDMYELGEDERQEVESEFGTEFSTGNDVDAPGEADIDVPDADDLDAAGESESADTEAASATDETETATETPSAGETTADEAASAEEASADEDAAPADVDLEGAVVDVMADLDDGDGADQEAVVAAVVDQYGADPGDVEDAIQDALMSGKCYEPTEGTLKSI